MKRKVFFISDRTGITSETLGHGLLSQFPDVEFEHHTLRYMDSVDKAETALNDIMSQMGEGNLPIIMSTLVDDEVRKVFQRDDVVLIDLFATFISPLEKLLGVQSTHAVGHSHGRLDDRRYISRIDAINYSINHDDGLNTRHYDKADVILVGVSRSGKTPTSLYMALQYGLFVANYPLTEEDLLDGELPKTLRPHTKKVFGLTLDAERLASIRNGRLRDSHYASVRQCQSELQHAAALFRQYRIQSMNVTDMSVEEIATTLIDKLHIDV
ncbi:MAG: kinase/pyrophosphorylase [Gammaproteobacteria bacterium]|nr:kinase/pyrophosphorylase [Gammaproteobacteria bacterium]